MNPYKLKLMRRKNLLPLLLLCAPLLYGSCGGGQTNVGSAPAAGNTAAKATPATDNTAQARPTPAAEARYVTATAGEARLKAGGAGEATVRLVIAEGYHVNANPATDKWLQPTELKAEPQQGVTPGKPVYPRALTKKFGFSETPLAVYEGSPVIRLPLRAEAGATRGQHTLRARVRVQPCNDEACLPPRDIDAPITVTID